MAAANVSPRTASSQARAELAGPRDRLPVRHDIPSLTAHVSEHRYRPTAAVALILSADPLAAALLGAAIELTGCSVAFAAPDESGAKAFRRIRPSFLLIDAGDENSCTGELLGPAMMTGTRAIVFGGGATVALRRELARQFQLETLVMPRDASLLPQLVSSAVVPAH